MTDQIKIVEQWLVGMDNSDEYDVLVHIATRQKADQIREQGFYATRNYSTVFTHRESALETPDHAGDRCCYLCDGENGLLDFEFYLSDNKPTNFITGTRGNDWDIITMVVLRDFHKGSTITHPVPTESLDMNNLPEDFRGWDPSRINVI